MDNSGDMIRLCLYCGDMMDELTSEQAKIWGVPNCCDTEMLLADRNKLFKIVKGLDKLKEKLEQEIIKGMV